MKANTTQVGGEHYKVRPYQHWDWVCDNKIPYLLAVATKYPTRWVEKNGIEDLKKSVHYLEKAIERDVKIPVDSIWDKIQFRLLGLTLPSKVLENKTRIFVLQLPRDEKEILMLISCNEFKLAITKLKSLIDKAEFGPGPHYIKG